MTKNEDIESKCEFEIIINPKTNLPTNAEPIPKESRIKEEFVGYCYDGRKNLCDFSVEYKNKSYCTYIEQKK
jgi:hypothetical protein